MPELSWVREVISELIRAVEPHVLSNTAPGGAKFIVTFGKPRPKADTKAIDRRKKSGNL